MSSAANAGIAFPRTRLGDAFHWLCETYAKKKEPEAAAATTATSTKDSAVTARSDGDNVAPAGATEATNGTDDKAAVTSVGEQNPPAVEGNGAGAGEAAEMEETEKPTWRAATFAPGFGKRYADGGQEHEAAYDAYLTGVCFAAAVTLGLGVGVEELKAMGSGGDVPTQLRPVLNVLPLYRMVRRGLMEARMGMETVGSALGYGRTDGNCRSSLDVLGTRKSPPILGSFQI